MATKPYAPPRTLLISIARDAKEVTTLLNYSAQHVVRKDDSVVLLHVRQADILSAAPKPYDAKEEPITGLRDDLLIGATDEAAAKAMAACKALETASGSEPQLIKLRSPLRILDALSAYISSLGDNKKADLLMMGSHTAACPPEHKVAFQSIVTSDVSQEIPIPVFLIRCVPEKGAMPQTPGAASGSPRRMVALAVDGRMPTSLLLAKYAARNIIAPTDDVQIVYKPVAGEEVPHTALSECVEAVKSAIGSGGTVRLNSNLEGADDARDALVDLASSGRVELLVLASRGPSALKRTMPVGSVCNYVIQHAPCPLVIVPPLALGQQDIDE